jgi:5-methylcytosine-specific restriction enzyme subunit McrC
LPLPIEITFDEFTTDIFENRVLKAATGRLLLVAGLPKSLTARLRELLLIFRDVGELSGKRPELTVYNRLNLRYRDAIRLATLILDGISITYRRGSVSSVAFLLDMNKAFEDFVTEVARRTSVGSQFSFRPQHSRWLDTENRLDFRPDLSWWMGERCVAVADVKYKATAAERVPTGDIYQMLAYCLVHRLSTGCLIYAQGEADAWQYEIRQSGITVAIRTLDLSGDGPQVRLRCERLIRDLVSAA